jgi:Uma2 family endonuclease
VQRTQRHYSLAEYFSIEEISPIKHEYFGGEIFAMAGASVEHNLIAGNVLALLKQGLRRSRCNVFGSDLRIGTPAGLYTYPDVSVICGKPKLLPGLPDTATNPVLLVEVLSPATCDYDRGDKFEMYKTVAAFEEYVLIDQERIAIEHFIRKRGAWQSSKLSRRSQTLALRHVRAQLPVEEIYRGVF